MEGKERTEKYETSWDILREKGQISPIKGLDAASLGQVAEYLGISVKDLQALRQKTKKDLEALGAFVATGREIGKRIAGAQRLENFGFRLPLSDGGFTEVPGSRITYFTAAAVMRLTGALEAAEGRSAVLTDSTLTPTQSTESKEVCHKIDKGVFDPDNTSIALKSEIKEGTATDDPTFESSQHMDVKAVSFLGSELMAVRDSDGTILAGVRWICEGIGLSEGQTKKERLRIQTDMVFSKGGRNLVLPTNSGYQAVLCLALDFVPLWLAKINVTRSMQKKNPELADRLVQYQLKAKDVLAQAFLLPQNKFQVLPQDLPSALRAWADQCEANMALAEKNKVLSITNSMLSKKEQQWNPRNLVNRLVRTYSATAYRGNFRLGWNDLYRELRYRKNIGLSQRTDGKDILDRVHDDEWPDVIAVAAALCHEVGANPSLAINQVNADTYLGDMVFER